MASKKIEVKPGAQLSLQMHHQDEHWIIVRTAKVTIDDKQSIIKENK